MRAAAPRRRGGPGTRTRTRPAVGDAAAPSPHAPERVQKFLSRAGIASRREVETWIRAGRLSVNGQPATLGARVRPGDQIQLDGRAVHARAGASAGGVFLCHRSPGEPLGEATEAAATTSLRAGLL